MIFSRAWFALMRRNLIYRRRHWVSTLFEFFLPICFVGILVSIKNAFDYTPVTFESQYFDAEDVTTPLTFGDYVTALQAQRFCTESGITGFSDSFWDVWQVPLVKCDRRRCEEDGQDAQPFCEYAIVAVAGTDEGGRQRALDMKNYTEARYPVLKEPEGKLPFDHDLLQIFDSPAAMDQYVLRSDYGKAGVPKLAMGIVFEGNDPQNYVYWLRQNSTNFNAPEEEGRPATSTTPDTGRLFDHYAKEDSVCETEGGTPYLGQNEYSCTRQYMFSGVLTFQRLVGDFILDRTGAGDAGYFVAEAGVRYVQFPTPTYEEQGFYSETASITPLLVVLGLLYPVASMIGYVVKEKEFRQKELMKMMSVTESDIGQAWFVSFFLFHLITATLTSMTASVFYENSDGSVMWLFWIFTFIAIIVFSMLIATFTSKSTRAVLIGLLFFLGGYFLTNVVDFDTGSGSTISLVSLHPVAAFTFGLQEISRLEDLGIGITPDSISFDDNPSGYNFQSTLFSLIGDSILWGVVLWYLNRVMKPDYGQALPFYFPFKVSYWCPSAAKNKTSADSDNDSSETNQGIPLEPVGENLKRQIDNGETIEIKGLKKRFGEKVAVDGLHLSMYSGQITALLGHNGAGKTTTINMITGAIAPTNGSVSVIGKDTQTDLPKIRQDLGVCLQHDCLFPNLTVREHIQFFSRLKGLYSKMPWQEAEAQIDQAIQDVALSEKRNTLSKNLSGGMKRKLSVAMAFCGGSKVVLLDEPTSGMDPFSRRFTWNVIRQYRQNRCIILTTHFMDEADILGDRIAIMAEGRLQCAGSSLFLKKTYGVGYQLTIEKKKVNMASKDATEANTLDDELQDIVSSSVKEASLLSNVGSEMSYQLPLGASSQFGSMFDELDRQVDAGSISSYGVSVTTLEEVFLLVARGHDTDHKNFASSKRLDTGEAEPSDNVTKSVRSKMDLENEALFGRHVRALFKKRAAVFRRDRKAWCCTTMVPSLFVTIGFLLFRFASQNRNLDALYLDLNEYNPKASSPRNPIIFNSADNPYQCQPGSCLYEESSFNIDSTSESYYFCGQRAQLDDKGSLCSISESDAIASTLSDYGSVGIAASLDNGTAITTVGMSSYSVGELSGKYSSSQFGALFFTHDQTSQVGDALYADLVEAACNNTASNYTGAEDCSRFGGIGYTMMYNFTALHVAPMYQAMADEALVRQATSDSDFSIRCTIAPLPITKSEQAYGEAEDVFVAWFLVVLSFPFIGGAFASFVVTERESKAKHLQTVAGVEPSSYWISSFLWDVLNYQIPLWITVALMFIFDVNVLTTKERDVFSGILAVLFFYGPATAGFSYCVSFGFKSPSLCNVILIVSGFLIGMGGPMTTFILSIIGEDPGSEKENLVNAATIVTWCLRWFPSFCLGHGIFYAMNVESISYWEGENLSVWSGPVLLWDVICLVIQTFVYLGLATLLDQWSTNPAFMSVCNNLWSLLSCKWIASSQGHRGPDITIALPEDDDVLAEQDRVLNNRENNDLVVIDRLTKIYGNGKVAVNSLSLGIPHGECFGLLGINGAGKTTTLSMLTAEFPPTSGDAILAGYSVKNNPEATRRRIGYCPQFDAHFPNLTGREHVELYASIKGVPKEVVQEAVAAKLKEVGLSSEDSDRLSAGYSGGMKRRLSLACAMIGQPQIVFLDECSTGVDPVARREIWQMISDMVSQNVPEQEKTSVILTTHSMEECEALCPRIGIMANGRLRCLGSAQRLKNKFGQGYQVELKIKVVNSEDSDYINNTRSLAMSNGGAGIEEGALPQVPNFTLSSATQALDRLTGDAYLSSMVSSSHPNGYSVWKDASSDAGVSLADLAAFATSELRMRNLDVFMKSSFPKHELRERQENKARYEVSSEGVRISSIFSGIEARKEELCLADYGVSQTSLEQVFNFHAAAAEELKQGRNDR